jgi:hypothetical protein
VPPVRRRQHADVKDLPAKVLEQFLIAWSYNKYEFVGERWRVQFRHQELTNTIETAGLMDPSVWDRWIRTFRLGLDTDLRRCETCDRFFLAKHGRETYCSKACRPKGKKRSTADDTKYRRENRAVLNRNSPKNPPRI